MKKSLLTLISVIILIMIASFAVNAEAITPEQILGEIQVFNSSGEVVKTYEVVTNDPEADSEPVIQKALTYCKNNATETDIHTVILPQGQYVVKSSLNVYSNTVVDLSSSVITRYNYNGSIIRFGSSSSTVYGYDGYRNITVKNGTLDAKQVGTSSLFRFAHAYNVEISNVIFKNTWNVQHLLTFAASEKVRVLNCQFRDMYTGEELEKNNCEAVQIDILKEQYFAYPAYDGTITKDVVISGCTFDNVPRGLGTHSGITGYYFDSISIKNNIFNNVSGYAIKVVNYINSEISGNVITDCGSGICCATVPNADLVNFYAPLNGDGKIVGKLNVKISGNNIAVKSNGTNTVAYGIRLHGENIVNYKDEDGVKFSADCRFGGVTVDNNVISSSVSHVSVYGIHIDGVAGSIASEKSDVAVKNNKITFTDTKASSNYIYGIKAESSSNVYIYANTITDLKTGKKNMHSGIITDSSSGIVASSNTVSNAKNYGIRFATTKNSIIRKNTITAMGNNGIYVYNKSSGVSVYSNNVSSCASYAVSVYNAGVADVKTNTLNCSSGYGIMVSNATADSVASNKVNGGVTVGINIRSSTVGKVYSNTVSNCKTDGIYLISSKVDTLKSNKITSCGGRGIGADSATLSSVSSNTIKKSGSDGFYAGSSKITSLKSNTVTSCSGSGIYLKNTTATDVVSNKIEKNKGYGIYLNGGKSEKIKSNKIYSASKYSLYLNGAKATTLSSNKIYNAKKTSIYIGGESKISTVSSNYVSGSKGTGIYLTGKAAVTSIIKNKLDVTSAKIDGIAVNSKAKAGKIKYNSINAKESKESKGLKVKCRYGIRINSSACKVSDIYKNTVKYCEKSGIYIAKMKKNAKVKIRKNTIAKAMYGVSYVKGTATVKDNTIRKCTKASTRVINKK